MACTSASAQMRLPGCDSVGRAESLERHDMTLAVREHGLTEHAAHCKPSCYANMNAFLHITADEMGSAQTFECRGSALCIIL